MKKLLLIICMMAVVFALPSCKYISRGGDRSEAQTENANTDPASQDSDATIGDSVDSLFVQMYAAQKNIAELNKDIEEMKANKLSTNSFFLFLAIFFVVVIVLVYFLVKKFGLSRKQVEQIASQVRTKEPAGHSNRGQGVSNSNEYFLVMNRMASLEKAINDINLRVSAMGSRTSTEAANANKTPDVNNSGSTSKADSRIFYLCKPSGDREFLDKDRRLVAQEDYLYKFELHKDDSKKATFEFCASKENCVRWALDSQSTMIDRVCDADIENRDNGRCKCTANGEAELRGGKWVVTKKAKVRFY